jgi:phage tail-like protein
MPETGKREDPYRSFNFLVEIDGVTVAGFSDVSGLTGDGDVIEYREGSEGPLTVRKLPGLFKWVPIVLKHGITTDRALWNWRRSILDGKTDRRNGSIVLLDEQRKRVMEWQFVNGWVSKYEGPTLNGKGTEVAVETAEIVHEGLRVA